MWQFRGQQRPSFAIEPKDGQESVWDYPRLIECYIDHERVRPKPGGFYGGWITNEIVGPWKGEPGTHGW